MKKNWSVLPLAALSLALGLFLGLAPAAASIPEIPDPDEAEFNARSLFISRKCEVRGVKDKRRVLLYDELGKETHEIQLDDKVKLRAASKKQFGRKKLRFSDFAVGQRVKVDIRKSDGRIMKIQVLPGAR